MRWGEGGNLSLDSTLKVFLWLFYATLAQSGFATELNALYQSVFLAKTSLWLAKKGPRGPLAGPLKNNPRFRF